MSSFGRRLFAIVVSFALGWSCPRSLRAAIPPPLESQSLSFEVGPTASAVAVGDLDLDGIADVLVANAQSPGWISVMRGDGNRFGLSSTTPVGNQPCDLTLADFNRDGVLDVAVVNRYSASVSLLFGTAGGNLGSRVDTGVGTYPEAICHGDFNGDGEVDLAVASAGTSVSAVELLLGAGDGTFPNRNRTFNLQ